MNTRALLITQYDRFGGVGQQEYLENYIHEELDVNIDMLSDYNEYLINNGYEPFYDDLNDMLIGLEPMQIVQKTYFGKFNYSDDYYQFNGYENIDSFSEYEVIREMKNDTDFLKWYIEENDLIDWDEAQKDIDEANELIKQGY